ncbi:MAG: hypothetical protein IT452_10985 [Planctomycetia bacterium]|nr:hypothetical protein [Planctomycetia bacterium]
MILHPPIDLPLLKSSEAVVDQLRATSSRLFVFPNDRDEPWTLNEMVSTVVGPEGSMLIYRAEAKTKYVHTIECPPHHNSPTPWAGNSVR